MSTQSNDEGHRSPVGTVETTIPRPSAPAAPTESVPSAPTEPAPSAPTETAPEATLDSDEGGTEKKKKKKKKDKLGSARGVETMFRTSYRTHIDLSALADTKANIMISINGIILSIIIASVSPKIDANPWLLLPTSVLLLGCLLSLVYAVFAARPRVSGPPLSLDDLREKRANILFFGNFASLPRDDYVQGMKELITDTDALYVSMLEDIYGLGSVLARKFRFLRVSYAIFLASLVVGVLMFVAVLVVVALTTDTPMPTGLGGV